MARATDPVKQALISLQAVIRRPPSGDRPTVTSGEVPEDLNVADDRAREHPQYLSLYSDEAEALTTVRSRLADDLRFEYLKPDELERVTWRFVCLVHFESRGDLVASFMAEHGRDPALHTCFFPVEFLTLQNEMSLYGVRLLPREAVDVPPTLFGHDPGPSMGSVVGVDLLGTSYEQMARRARSTAERALRLLRASLREEPWLPAFQLRFRLGEQVWFDDSIRAGWSARPDEASDLELDDRLLRRATSQAISKLPEVSKTEVQKRAELALQWFERAQLATDPSLELLYLFFALEAILGDKSEGQKGHALAVRRAMLGLLVSDGFTQHPTRTCLLYDKVRSAAVHGEEAPVVDQRAVDRFAWDVRRAINEFLELAEKMGFSTRSRVREALDESERRKTLIGGLVRDDPQVWGKYFATPSREDSGD